MARLAGSGGVRLAGPAGQFHRGVQLLLAESGAHHLDERPYLTAVERPRAILRTDTRLLSKCFGCRGLESPQF